MEDKRTTLKKLGDWLRREGVNRRLTQTEVAELVPLNIRTLQRAEAGHVNLRYTTFIRLMQVIGSHPDNLGHLF